MGVCLVAGQAADDLGESVSFEEGGGGEGGLGEPVELLDAAVAGQSQAGGTGLDGPDAAAVVAERVVGGVIGGQGPDATAAKEVGSIQSEGEGGGDASR